VIPQTAPNRFGMTVQHPVAEQQRVVVPNNNILVGTMSEIVSKVVEIEKR